MSKITCPHCGVEMTMQDIACLGNPSTNGIIYCCPMCTYKTFIPRSPVTACTNKSKPTNHFADAGKMVCCKDCAHLEYEDLGVYYCGLHRIAGQLSPDDYCSRATAREEANP